MNSKEYFDRTAKEYDEGYDGRFVRCMYPEIVRQVKELQGRYSGYRLRKRKCHKNVGSTAAWALLWGRPVKERCLRKQGSGFQKKWCSN